MPTDDLTAVELQQFEHTAEFEGEAFGTSVSFILVDMPPGEGVRLHTHPYAEIFIVQEGHARYAVGDATIESWRRERSSGPPTCRMHSPTWGMSASSRSIST